MKIRNERCDAMVPIKLREVIGDYMAHMSDTEYPFPSRKENRRFGYNSTPVKIQKVR
ncbi:hypothetical protein ACIQZI_24150 [Peribacillus sp. NPDC096379]|uniref:hypothetical protein n=1 Tax=Peribacillus sp. NPDC096379 TaxID=3364393 RepID=UPI0012F8047E